MRSWSSRDCSGDGVPDDCEPDCDGDGVPDPCEPDCNANGLPDECDDEPCPIAHCFGFPCPCGNDGIPGGCASSTGVGAVLTAAGSSSVAANALVLTATGCPPQNSALLFAGDTIIGMVQVGDGFACVGGSSYRYFPGQIDAGGTFVRTDVVASAPPGYIVPGVIRHFQVWYRDVLCGPPPSPCPSPCGHNNNLSNALQIEFVP